MGGDHICDVLRIRALQAAMHRDRIPLLVTVTRYCTGEAMPALVIVLVTVMFGAFGVRSRQALTVCALPLFGVTVVALFKPPALVVGAVAGHSALPAVGVTALVTVNGIETV